MKDSEVRTAVTAWVAGLFAVGAVSVVEAYPAQELTPPYITVNLTTISQVRQHEQRTEFTKGEQPADPDEKRPITAAPVIETEWMLSIQAYAEDPTALLRPLWSACKLPEKDESLRPLHIHQTSQIRYVPDFVNNRWEPRAQMDLFVRGLVMDGFVIDTIEQFSFETETV